MSWLFPAFLAGGALMALPLILHFIRRKPTEQVPFPTLRFLGKRAVRDSNKHRIRRWLVLAMRCLLLLLFAAAFARPFWPSPAADAETSVVVVLDNSASMHADGRRDANIGWLRGELNALGPADVAGVLEMHPQPHWLVAPGTLRDEAMSQLEAWQPGYESSNFRPAVRLAGQVLATAPAETRRLLIATDHQALGWHGVDLTQPLPPGIEIAFSPPAEAPANQAAVTETTARIFPRSVEVTGRIKLFAPESTKRTVVLRDENSGQLASREITLTAGEPTPVTFSVPRKPSMAATGWTLALDGDGMNPDNERHVVINPEDGLKVLLDDTAGQVESTDFLRFALDAARNGGLAPMDLQDYPKGDWPTRAVAVVRGSQALGEDGGKALEAWIRNGGNAWIMAGRSAELNAWLEKTGVPVKPVATEEGKRLRLRDWAMEHPLVGPFAGDSLGLLLDMEFKRGFELGGEAVEPLAVWEGGATAVGELRLGQGRVLITGFDGRRSSGNWPLQASYLPFAHAALIWLGENRADENGQLVGELAPVPAGKGEWMRLGTDGGALPKGASPADRPGLYRFTPENGTPVLLAVNLAPAESDLTPWPDLEAVAQLQNPESAPPAEAGTQTHIAGLTPPEQENDNLWWWLLAGVFALLLAELTLANRTAL